ncbi:MAG TPA: LysR family transcriptional regulator [Steroidobacter sp.]
MFDWNDLKYLLAVANHGSTVAAAKALGVNQSTVQRRLVELERQLGRPLLVREPSGYELTPLARELLPLAEKVATAIGAFELRVKSTAPDGRDIIRLTCPEPVVGRLQHLIEKFHRLHPQCKVEFVTSDRYLDLLKGEADIAFRSGDTDEALVGFKVADSVWAVYASPAYIQQHGKPATAADLNRHTVLSLEESMSRHRLVLWLNEVAPDAEVASRSNSILGLVQAAKSGIGIAPLPMSVADEAGLVKVLGPIPELARTWKLLTHPRLRETARIAAFFDFIADEREVVRGIFG